MPHRAANAPKLSGEGIVKIVSGTQLHTICKRDELQGEFFCNYEVNPEFESRFAEAGLTISARGPAGEIRAAEIPGHRFFHATLFQPQLTSRARRPHPVLMAFLRAAAEFKKSRSGQTKAAGH